MKDRRLFIAIVLNIGITLSQDIGGLISGSLALLSDALHNFSDVMALLISYLADMFANKDFSHDHTFGHKRAEILAAMINVASLLFIGVYLIKEATVRLYSDAHRLWLVDWPSTFEYCFERGFCHAVKGRRSRKHEYQECLPASFY